MGRKGEVLTLCNFNMTLFQITHLRRLIVIAKIVFSFLYSPIKYVIFILSQVFLETLAQIFLCQQRRKRKRDISRESEEVEISRLHLVENNCRIRNLSETDTNTESTQIEENNSSSIKTILDTLLALKINLSSIDIAVHRMLRHKMTVQKDASEAEVKWKWRLVALILDRIFMVLYVVIILISLILLLPRANY